jgi:Rrf2 family protein
MSLDRKCCSALEAHLSREATRSGTISPYQLSATKILAEMHDSELENYKSSEAMQVGIVKRNSLSYIKEMSSCRFAFAVHVMAVLALRRDQCCPSSRLADTVNTNPVVIRRLLIDLQNAGLIRTQRGPRGGAFLHEKPEKVSLFQIHAAVGSLELFGAHPNRPSRDCPVGKRIESVMQQIQARANRSIERELQKITLADVLRELKAG